MDSIDPQLPVSTDAIGPRTILSVILAYAIFGFAWICASDLLAYFRGSETWQVAVLSLAKGMLFVASSSVVLYLVLARCVRNTAVERDTFREKLRHWNLHGNDIVLLLDAHGRIIEANDRAVAAYGYPAAQLAERKITDLLTDTTGLQKRWESLLETGTLRSEVIHRRADGSTFPVEFSARRFDLGGSILIHTVIRDITARQDTETQLTILKDIYAALFQTNQCISRGSNRDEMFQRICEIVICHTHLKLAWIGLVDWESETIVPVAQAGPAAEYVDGLHLSVNAESPWSKGVGGQAVLTGLPVVTNELWKSHGFEAWMEKLTAHGIQSWAAYPLFQSGRVAGVLTLYSNHPNFFTDQLAELLGEMAEDLSLALDRLALASKQTELEAELQRLQTAVEQSPVTVVISDPTGAIQYVNPAFTASSGYSADEVSGKNPSILKSGETSSEAYAVMWKRLKQGEPWTGLFHNKRKDGSLYWEEAVISPVKDSQGEKSLTLLRSSRM